MENFNFSDIKIKEFSTDELKQTEKISSKKSKSSPRKSESACEGTSSLLLVCVFVWSFCNIDFFPFFGWCTTWKEGKENSFLWIHSSREIVPCRSGLWSVCPPVINFAVIRWCTQNYFSLIFLSIANLIKSLFLGTDQTWQRRTANGTLQKLLSLLRSFCHWFISNTKHQKEGPREMSRKRIFDKEFRFMTRLGQKELTTCVVRGASS